MRKCTKCGEEKIVSEFYLRSDGSGDGIRSDCKQCVRLNVAAYRKADPIRLKNTWLKQDFGITMEQYNELFAAQNGCCAICEAHPAKQKRHFAVDHDHATGKIRGILCTNCNTAIGKMEEDPIRMRRAAEYVEGANKSAVLNLVYLPHRGRRGGRIYPPGYKKVDLVF